MTITLSLNALLGIAMPCGAYVIGLWLRRHRSTPYTATIAAWSAWKEVSTRALSAGKDVPAIPFDAPPKR